MHTKLFFIGLFLFLVSFFIPVRTEMPVDFYGYDLALTPFDVKDMEWSEIPGFLFLTITNIAVLITAIAYAKYRSKKVSALSVVGTLVSVYWFVLMISDPKSFPGATFAWATGSLLITVGYELKRRRHASL